MTSEDRRSIAEKLLRLAAEVPTPNGDLHAVQLIVQHADGSGSSRTWRILESVSQSLAAIFGEPHFEQHVPAGVMELLTPAAQQAVTVVNSDTRHGKEISYDE